MTSVQATYRARLATSELIDLTRPSEPGLVRRYGWAVALVVAGAGLLGFVIAGLTEPGYTAGLCRALAGDAGRSGRGPGPVALSGRAIGGGHRSSAPASPGCGPSRWSMVGDPAGGRAGLRAQPGQGPDHRRRRGPGRDGRADQQASVAHDAVAGGVRRLGLEPARTSIVAAGTGLVLSPCVLFVMAYFGLLDRRPVVVPSPSTAAGSAPLEQP